MLEHFEILLSCEIDNKDLYSVIPMFLINAPTLYMYDSPYLVMTLHDLSLYLKGEHKTYEFTGAFNGQEVNFRAPYLTNAENLFSFTHMYTLLLWHHL